MALVDTTLLQPQTAPVNLTLLVGQGIERRGVSLAKRAVDIAVSAVLLLGALPVLAFVALAIKLDSPGPVFFSQERAGFRGRSFRMIKFRSMVEDAEARLDEVAAANEADGLLFKIKADPRVTRVGRFIRKLSIDELPQLINVLRGEMSLVGPRPLPVSGSAFGAFDRRRLEVRPGITGMWQTAGRSDLTYDDMIRLDLTYVSTCSVWTDLRILARTVPVVLRGSGAY